MSFHKKPKTINPNDVDPSVYYYDEVYDDMKDEEKAERDHVSSSKKSEKQGSKYIQGLLETAELRKTEKEIRKFKKYARDREEAEAEGLIDQTEVYVTAAYKRKLEEIKQLDKEKRSRIDSEESLMLNTHKRHRKDQTAKDHEDQVHQGADEMINESRRNAQQGTSQQQQVEVTISEKAPRRQLRTSEGKRNYLREVLAKRTVGDKFLEAVRRYKERQADLQVI